MSKSLANFGGLRVVAFESRRAAELAEMIQNHGGMPLVTPALREAAPRAIRKRSILPTA